MEVEPLDSNASDTTRMVYGNSSSLGMTGYKARSANGGVAVFSEVFFPWGWEAKIDGQPAEIGRVNYILRALSIPAGEHSIEMTFRPASVTRTVAAARVSVIIIYILLALALLQSLTTPRKENEPA